MERKNEKTHCASAVLSSTYVLDAISRRGARSAPGRVDRVLPVRSASKALLVPRQPLELRTGNWRRGLRAYLGCTFHVSLAYT